MDSSSLRVESWFRRGMWVITAVVAAVVLVHLLGFLGVFDAPLDALLFSASNAAVTGSDEADDENMSSSSSCPTGAGGGPTSCGVVAAHPSPSVSMMAIPSAVHGGFRAVREWTHQVQLRGCAALGLAAIPSAYERQSLVHEQQQQQEDRRGDEEAQLPGGDEESSRQPPRVVSGFFASCVVASSPTVEHANIGPDGVVGASAGSVTVISTPASPKLAPPWWCDLLLGSELPKTCAALQKYGTQRRARATRQRRSELVGKCTTTAENSETPCGCCGWPHDALLEVTRDSSSAPRSHSDDDQLTAMSHLLRLNHKELTATATAMIATGQAEDLRHVVVGHPRGSGVVTKKKGEFDRAREPTASYDDPPVDVNHHRYSEGERSSFAVAPHAAPHSSNHKENKKKKETNRPLADSSSPREPDAAAVAASEVYRSFISTLPERLALAATHILPRKQLPLPAFYTCPAGCCGVYRATLIASGVDECLALLQDDEIPSSASKARLNSHSNSADEQEHQRDQDLQAAQRHCPLSVPHQRRFADCLVNRSLSWAAGEILLRSALQSDRSRLPSDDATTDGPSDTPSFRGATTEPKPFRRGTPADNCTETQLVAAFVSLALSEQRSACHDERTILIQARKQEALLALEREELLNRTNAILSDKQRREAEAERRRQLRTPPPFSWKQSGTWLPALQTPVVRLRVWCLPWFLLPLIEGHDELRRSWLSIDARNDTIVTANRQPSDSILGSWHTEEENSEDDAERPLPDEPSLLEGIEGAFSSIYAVLFVPPFDMDVSVGWLIALGVVTLLIACCLLYALRQVTVLRETVDDLHVQVVSQKEDYEKLKKQGGAGLLGGVGGTGGPGSPGGAAGLGAGGRHHQHSNAQSAAAQFASANETAELLVKLKSMELALSGQEQRLTEYIHRTVTSSPRDNNNNSQQGGNDGDGNGPGNGSSNALKSGGGPMSSAAGGGGRGATSFDSFNGMDLAGVANHSSASMYHGGASGDYSSPGGTMMMRPAMGGSQRFVFADGQSQMPAFRGLSLSLPPKLWVYEELPSGPHDKVLKKRLHSITVAADDILLQFASIHASRMLLAAAASAAAAASNGASPGSLVGGRGAQASSVGGYSPGRGMQPAAAGGDAAVDAASGDSAPGVLTIPLSTVSRLEFRPAPSAFAEQLQIATDGEDIFQQQHLVLTIRCGGSSLDTAYGGGSPLDHGSGGRGDGGDADGSSPHRRRISDGRAGLDDGENFTRKRLLSAGRSLIEGGTTFGARRGAGEDEFFSPNGIGAGGASSASSGPRIRGRYFIPASPGLEQWLTFLETVAGGDRVLFLDGARHASFHHVCL